MEPWSAPRSHADKVTIETFRVCDDSLFNRAPTNSFPFSSAIPRQWGVFERSTYRHDNGENPPASGIIRAVFTHKPTLFDRSQSVQIMHILVTNDDGVTAPGLLALAQQMRSLWAM